VYIVYTFKYINIFLYYLESADLKVTEHHDVHIYVNKYWRVKCIYFFCKRNFCPEEMSRVKFFLPKSDVKDYHQEN